MVALAHSLADKVRYFVNKLFTYFRTTSVKSIPEVVPEEKPEPRKPRKYNKEKRQDFSSLLDQLEHTFNIVKLFIKLLHI